MQTHLWLVVENCRQINWTSKCTKLQMTALWDVWKQFHCCSVPVILAALYHRSGKVGQMLRVREAPVGYWEWWFGRERGTIKGGDGRGQGSLFTTPDLPWNLFSFIWNERKVPFVMPNTNLHLHLEQGFSICLVRMNSFKTMVKPRRSIGFKHLRGACVE